MNPACLPPWLTGPLAALALLALAGCAPLAPQAAALRADWPAGVARQAELAQVPFFPQGDARCAPAALASVLNYSGVLVGPEALAGELGLPARKGSLQLEMVAAPRRHGRVSYRLQPSYADLLREVAAGNPVVVLQDADPLAPFPAQWHYAVVNGFDGDSGTVLLRSCLEPRLELAFGAFERGWKAGKYWAMVALPPGQPAATATEERWLAALLGLARGGDVDATVQGYAAALERWPDSLPAAIGLANSLHARGSLAEAVGVLGDALQRNPQSVIVLNNLAQTLSELGRNAEALDLIDRVKDPRSPFATELRSTRAMIRERMK